MDIEEFDIFEKREERFQQLVGVSIPRLHGGPVQLLQDVVSLFRGQFQAAAHDGAAPIYILSNPADGFVYQNPLQELQAAAIVALAGRGRVVDPVVLAAAKKFSLSKQNLEQPITTLSGGEAVKLSFARAYILREISSRMVVSSPLTWLSAGNRHLFDSLVADFGAGAKITLLNMRGENDPSVATFDPSTSSGSEISFTISCESVSVELAEAASEQGLSRRASVSDWSETCQSPCLMLGENGSGKSLFCKILSGAMFHAGRVRITSGDSTGRGRLIFQDSIAQTMARDRGLLLHEHCCSSEQKAQQSYTSLVGSLREELRRWLPIAHDDDVVEYLHGSSLLSAKLNLIAYRLSQRPPLVILDEPDWGISRDVAISLVIAVTKVAHANGVSIIVVSHKPWWRGICNSVLRLIRLDELGGLGDGGGFEISLTKEPT